MVQQAIILAAGLGSRLGNRTTDLPKCMVEVGGEPMLTRALRALERVGVPELVIVTGHKHEVIDEYVAHQSTGMQVRTVYNPLYATTNNIVSLWAARDLLSGDFMLLESDLVLSEALLRSMAEPCAAAVAAIQPWMSGTVVSLDASSMVDGMYLKEHAKPDRTLYKTVNIYSIGAREWRGDLVKRLERAVVSGDTGSYYEKIFAQAVAEGTLRMRGVEFDNRRWYEVDTPEDLAAAESLLGTTAPKAGRA